MKLSSVSNYIPEMRIASSEQMVKNLTRIAVPAIALGATAMLQQAQAITYVECINNCDRHRDADAFSKFLCYALCLIFSKG